MIYMTRITVQYVEKAFKNTKVLHLFLYSEFMTSVVFYKYLKTFIPGTHYAAK